MNESKTELAKSAEAQYLYTTLNLLRKADACSSRYAYLVESLGGVSFNPDAPINLLTILKKNGLNDALEALCATSENCDKVAYLMAADFAESTLHIFEAKRPDDDRPRKAIQSKRDFAHGRIGADSMAAAWVAARDAAMEASLEAAGDTAGDVSIAAARDAAWAAVRDIAGDVAGASVWAAAWAAAKAPAGNAAGDAAWVAARNVEREKQEAIFRSYLLDEE
jgi:hypothetical protein